MKKVFTIKTFIFSFLLLLSITAFSFVAIKKAAATCADARQCCRKAANSGSEMIWDQVTRHFGALISF